MKNKKSDTAKSLPKKILHICLTITIFIIAILGWLSWNLYSNARNLWFLENQLKDLTNEIIYLDELLTMSARLAATTGDMKWERRYKLFEPKLDSVIKSLKKMAPDEFSIKGTELTDSANIKLVSMEYESLRLVADGKHEKAVELLFSSEYEKNKIIYRDGNVIVVNNLKKRMIESHDDNQKTEQITLILIGISFLLIFLAWLFSIRIMKKYIFEHEISKEALFQINEYNRMLIESNLDALVTISPDGKVTDVNISTEKITGFTREQIVGTDFSNYFTNPEKARKGYLKVFNEGTVRDYELYIQHLDGHCTPVIYNASLYRDKNNTVIGVLAAARDISELKRIEKELNQYRERLEYLVNERTFEIENKNMQLHKYSRAIEQSPVSILITDIKGNIEYVNAKFLNVSGYDYNDVIGKNPRILKSGEKSTEEYKELWSMISSGKEWRGELHNKKKNGELFWELVSISPIHYNSDEITNYIAIKEDITERKKIEESTRKSELLFRSVWDSSFNGMRVVDVEGKIIIVNRAFCELVEKTKAELEGKFMSVIYPHENESKVLSDYKNRFALKTVPPLFEKEIKLWNGKTKWFEISSSFLEIDKPYLLCIFKDITSRKAAEKSLQEAREELSRSERKYRQLVETAQEGIIQIDTSGIIVYNNRRMTEMLRCESNDLIDKSIFSLLDQKNTAILKEKLENLKKGISEQYELEMIKKDESKIYVNISDSLITNNEEVIIGSFGIFTDITEKKIIEELLISERHLFDSIMNNTPDFIYFKDIEGKFIRINRAFSNWLELKNPSDALGLDDFDLFIPEFAERFRKEEQELIISGKPIINIDEMMTDKNNKIIWNSVTKMLFKNRTGEIAGVLGIHRDISERKLLEQVLWNEKEELKITLSSVGDGVITTDSKGCILLFNEKAEEITAWKQEEAINKPITEIFLLCSKTKDSLYFNPIRKLLSSNERNNTTAEAILINKLNEDRIINYTVSSILGKDSQRSGFIIVFRDITEQKMMESQTVLSQKMESIGQLAAGISHEINTPMQYIGDNTRFIFDAFKDISEIINCIIIISELKNNEDSFVNAIAQLRELIIQIDLEYLNMEIPNAIEQSMMGIERVRNIVLAMKDFAHPGIKSKSFANLNHGIEVTVTISRNEWKYVADLETDLEADLPMVFCNLDEINQVILNMIVNSSHSIKEVLENNASKKGFIRIVTKSDSKFVIIKISDTGKGIPGGIMNRIFDPFFTTKQVGKGTGQGLAIAHDIIVNKHKGNIHVESEVGKGTIFTIKIPIKEETEV